MKFIVTLIPICLTMAIFNCVSCTTQKPIKVVYDCPKIILPSAPIPPIKQLKNDSPPDEVIKAWVATAIVYRDWQSIVRRQVDASQ